MWVILSSVLVAALYAAAVFCALRAAATARTPQGAVGWVVFLIAAPVLALPAYLFLGHHRISGYLVSRRETRLVVDAVREFSARNAPGADPSGINRAPFEACANLKAVRGNGMDLLIDGAATYPAIFDAIDAARDYVLVQYYIIHDDEIGQALKARLIAAAARGVTVRLMTDGVGCIALPDRFYAELRDAGVQIPDPRQSPGPRFRFQINYRNHRKTVIVDGITGFTGGLNVGREYDGRDPRFGPWRDTHVKLQGPIVSQLQLIFVEDWHWATGETLRSALNWEAPHHPDDLTGLIVATGPADLRETGSLMFFSAIAAARERIWIATPYFVPDIDIITALRHAALRGVDVRILMPDRIDHRLPWLAAFSFFDDLMRDGVRIFRYMDGFMHQKVFVVDDTLAAIGTANLDNRSFRLNFEAMALFFDARAAAAVDRMLCADLEKAFELSDTLVNQPAYIRYGAPVARLFAPLL